jgi:2',3'-cyclic-nucleotide 2'-phosphodiesterase/3'-nucleotidase
VTRRWVESLYVYDNGLVVVRLTGADVADVLEHAARWYDGLDCAPDGCVVLSDPRVAPYNVDTMAGLSYGIDPRRPEGHRVHDIVWNGRPLDPHRVFTVAVNSYRAAGGGGFPHLATAERARTIDRSITDLIAEHLEHVGAWTPRVDANWSLAPVVVGERPARRQDAP